MCSIVSCLIGSSIVLLMFCMMWKVISCVSVWVFVYSSELSENIRIVLKNICCVLNVLVS